MPSFLHSLRRKGSRQSSHDKTNESSLTKTQYGFGRRPSSSTMTSSPAGSSTPSTTPATSTTEGEAPPVPAQSTRPQRPSVDPVKRYSMNVSTRQHMRAVPKLTRPQGLSTTPTNGSGSLNSFNRSSLLAPRIISVSENSWVCGNLLGV